MFKRNIPSVSRMIKRNYADESSTTSDIYSPPCYWTVLDNGVRVVSEETCAPLACVTLCVAVGPRFEIPCFNGASHFIEHLAFKGFQSLGQREFEKDLRRAGIKLSAHTYRDMQSFRAICPSESVETVVCYLSRILIDLDPNEAMIEYEKCIIYQELLDQDKNPKAIMFDYLHETAFQGTPLAQRVIGPTKNLCRFQKDLLLDFLEDHYKPHRLILTASGCFSHCSFVACVQKHFGKLKPLTHDAHSDVSRYTGSQVMFRDDSLPRAHVALGLEAPGYGTPDYWIMRTLSCMLGRWNKSMGGGYKAWPELAQASAVAKLCDSYEPFYFAYGDVGLWGVYFVAKSLALEDMVYNVQNTLMNMCCTARAPDTKRAVAALKLEVARSMDGGIKSCRDMEIQMMYTCKRKSLQDIIKKLDCVKADHIPEVTSQYMYDKCPVVASVGPSEGLPEYNRIRSGMYWLRV